MNDHECRPIRSLICFLRSTEQVGQDPTSDEFVETESEAAAHNEGLTFRNYPQKRPLLLSHEI